jgi:hypothetical protein
MARPLVATQRQRLRPGSRYRFLSGYISHYEQWVLTQLRRPWTVEELDKLQSMARKYPVAQIASEIGRPLGSVKGKAHERDISLPMDRRHQPKIHPEPRD